MENLIPQHWFEGLPAWVLLSITAVAIAVLVQGAHWLVESASSLARRLGVSKVVVGATVVSLGTTSPEAAVSVMAAWSGEPGLALGNAVGSIIADTGLIFGIGCLFAILPADRFILKRQGWVQFGAGVLLALVCYALFFVRGDDASIGRLVGAFFLGLLVVYMVISVRWSRLHPSGVVESVPRAAGRSTLFFVSIGVTGLLLVLFSSRVLICSVSTLAERWGVPQVVIAATLVAAGTSLPELAVALSSIAKGHPELLVGNVIGADILNVLFVVGASAAAAPLPIVEAGTAVPRIFLCLHLPVMLIVLALFRLFIHRAVPDGRFRRWYGIPLVLIYASYVLVQFVISTGRPPAV